MLNALKKDEDSGDAASYAALDKATVLQDARAFNETPIAPRRCRFILSKLLFLIYSDTPLTRDEATATFFSITKLFQNQDAALRQMVYLAIKELADKADDVLMITSSVTKDMNIKSDVVYRANAVRALCKILDPSMIQGIERFLKQAIVDRNTAVASAALVSACHLFASQKEVVKRWVNEVQEAINSKGATTQYHALGLMFMIKQHDKMAVIKMVQTLSRGSLRSPLAYCMLVRYSHKILEDGDGDPQAILEMLEGWLRHKSDMVVYEAARAICAFSRVTAKELFPAVSALQLMLANHKSSIRFAAIRTLNSLAATQPTAVAACNLDMENLITDPNRSIATFAITTLLKTGNEASVDRLMKQISSFMSEISDEFKVIVVEAIRALCLKFPAKQAAILAFLAQVLRDEGGYEYKKAVVEAVFDIIRYVPESKPAAMAHLCEFIEDCEFTKLSVRILHLLGVEGPKSPQPSKYIKFIYNRVILENATIRAAAVASLARFAVLVPELKGRIRILLARCLDDYDDEVRDRATMFLAMLDDDKLSARYIRDDSTLAWSSLEQMLVNYLNDASAQAAPFDMEAVPVVSREEEEQTRLKQKKAAFDAKSAPAQPAAQASQQQQQSTAAAHDARSAAAPGEALALVKELAVLGRVIKTSASAELTESETEYVVSVCKHVLADYLVFQFDIKNTLGDTVLENVHVKVMLTDYEEPEEDEAPPELLAGHEVMKRKLSSTPHKDVRVPLLGCNESGTAYIVYEKPKGVFPVASFSCALRYKSKEIDPATGEPEEEGYDDEYLLEDFDVLTADYITPAVVFSFQRKWDEIGDACEMVETYALTAVPTIRDAIAKITELLGMEACEGSAAVLDARQPTHTLLLAGSFLGAAPVLARARMIADNGVTMELAARSADPMVCSMVVNAIR